MSAHKRKYRHKHKKNQDTIRAWRLWENGTWRFGQLLVALREDRATVYRQATGHEYHGPESFDAAFEARLFLARKDDLQAWADQRASDGQGTEP